MYPQYGGYGGHVIYRDVLLMATRCQRLMEIVVIKIRTRSAIIEDEVVDLQCAR